MAEKPSKLKTLAAFAAVYFIWGSTFVAIRFAVESIPPFLMAGTRFAIAGAILYIWARLRGAAVPALRQWIPAFVMGTLLLVCGNGGVVLAEKTVASGMVSLLVAIVPIYFAMLEWWRPGGSPPGMRVGLGISVGLIGLLVLLGPSVFSAGIPAINLQGASFVLIGSLCWSIGSIYSRYFKVSEYPAMGTAMQTLAAGFVFLVTSLLSNEPQAITTAISMKAILSLAYLIVFGSLIGFTAYVWLLQNVRSSLVSTYAYVNPVVAVLLGSLLAGESITPHSMFAAGIILVAVWLITQAKAPSHKLEVVAIVPPVSSVKETFKV